MCKNKIDCIEVSEIEKDMTPILLEDLGNRFPAENSKERKRFGRFLCQYCGNEFEAHTQAIKRGIQKSCGCLLGEKHKESHTRLYKIWIDMRRRCYNQNNTSYSYYGGRGIIVCDEWKNSYISFREWSFNNDYNDELSIDRIDVDGNYEPSNCRWVTRRVQNQNTRILKSNNTSGFRGVYFRTDSNRWRACITVDLKRISLGSFETALEGAIAYNNYVIKNNLEHTLNIIPEDYLQQINKEN